MARTPPERTAHTRESTLTSVSPAVRTYGEPICVESRARTLAAAHPTQTHMTHTTIRGAPHHVVYVWCVSLVALSSLVLSATSLLLLQTLASGRAARRSALSTPRSVSKSGHRAAPGTATRPLRSRARAAAHPARRRAQARPPYAHPTCAAPLSRCVQLVSTLMPNTHNICRPSLTHINVSARLKRSNDGGRPRSPPTRCPLLCRLLAGGPHHRLSCNRPHPTAAPTCALSWAGCGGGGEASRMLLL